MKDKKQGIPTTPTGTTLKMGIKERLIVGQLLPEKGNLLEQRLMKDILSKSELTQKQMEQAKMVSTPERGITWDIGAEKKVKDLDVHFSEAEIGFLKDQVKRIDENSDVTRDTFEFCEKINNLNKTEEK